MTVRWVRLLVEIIIIIAVVSTLELLRRRRCCRRCRILGKGAGLSVRVGDLCCFALAQFLALGWLRVLGLWSHAEQGRSFEIDCNL